MEWKPINLKEIKPIYEISPEGEVRRSDTGRIFTGGKRVMLTMADGSYKHFFRCALKNAVYNESSDIRFDDDVMQLMDDIKLFLKNKYKKIIFTVNKSNVKDMFSIHCDKFKYPFSVKKEYNGTYVIRTGSHWNDPFYYGGTTKSSHTYKEYHVEEIMNGIDDHVHKKVYNNPRYKESRPYNYKPSITEEECVIVCKLFVQNGFKLVKTINMCKERGIPLSYRYAHNIATKQRFREISDLYFSYFDGEYGEPCLFKKEEDV